MSDLNFGTIASALEKRSGYDGDAPPKRTTHRPRWLVDAQFDEAMAAMYPAADNAEELLPRRQRLGILLGLALLAWVPILLVGAWLWN